MGGYFVHIPRPQKIKKLTHNLYFGVVIVQICFVIDLSANTYLDLQQAL